MAKTSATNSTGTFVSKLLNDQSIHLVTYKNSNFTAQQTCSSEGAALKQAILCNILDKCFTEMSTEIILGHLQFQKLFVFFQQAFMQPLFSSYVWFILASLSLGSPSPRAHSVLIGHEWACGSENRVFVCKPMTFIFVWSIFGKDPEKASGRLWKVSRQR